MKLRAARAAAGTMGGRKRVRARCVRMPKASMQWVHLSIYSFPLFLPLFRKFYYRSTSTGKKPAPLLCALLCFVSLFLVQR